MFGRIYPSTRITNNRLDCAIEHRTLPTTTTHYYYPLPTDIGPYSIYLHFSECFTSDLSGIVFLSTLGFFGIHDHWPSLVFIVIGTINIGHHWHQYHGTSLDYRTTLTHLGDQPLDISKEHHYRTSLSDIIIGHHYHHETLDIIIYRRHHDWALLNHCWILSTYADAGASMI